MQSTLRGEYANALTPDYACRVSCPLHQISAAARNRIHAPPIALRVSGMPSRMEASRWRGCGLLEHQTHAPSSSIRNVHEASGLQQTGEITTYLQAPLLIAGLCGRHSVGDHHRLRSGAARFRSSLLRLSGWGCGIVLTGVRDEQEFWIKV